MTVVELKALAKKKKVSLSAGEKKSDIVNALFALVRAVKPAVKQVATPVKKTVRKVFASIKPAAKRTIAAKPAPRKTAKPVKVSARGKSVAKKRAPAVKSAVKKAVVAAKPAARKSVKLAKSIPSGMPIAKKRASDDTKPRTTPVREWKLPPGTEEPLMAQERIEESKYYTGPSPQTFSASTGELPRGYNEEKISILSRDPFVAFAYWEATPARIEREKAWFGWDSKLAVRVYDITGVQFDGRNAIGYFDQEVVDRVGSWYFDFGRPTHSFCADLGLISPSGRFLTITRSNYITMPRDGVSDMIDEEWMLVDEEFWKLYGYPEGFRRGVSSPEMQEMLKRRREMEITSPGLFSRERPKRK